VGQLDAGVAVLTLVFAFRSSAALPTRSAWRCHDITTTLLFFYLARVHWRHRSGW
jgi:hypothetical protein